MTHGSPLTSLASWSQLAGPPPPRWEVVWSPTKALPHARHPAARRSGDADIEEAEFMRDLDLGQGSLSIPDQTPLWNTWAACG